jgi:hypothetical protein
MSVVDKIAKYRNDIATDTYMGSKQQPCENLR